MKLPYVAQQVGNAYFYRLTEIKELSGSLWWMHEGRNLLKPVAGSDQTLDPWIEDPTENHSAV